MGIPKLNKGFTLIELLVVIAINRYSCRNPASGIEQGQGIGT